LTGSQARSALLLAVMIHCMAAADHIVMPAAPVLHLKNSYGEVAIEGWDRPEVEIITTQSSPKIRIAAERSGDEVLVTTTLPKLRVFPPPDPFQPVPRRT